MDAVLNAEHMPLAVFTTTGARLATPADLATTRQLFDAVQGGAIIRYLNKADPHDQRMIWYFVALALSASLTEALSATAVEHTRPHGLDGYWVLNVHRHITDDRVLCGLNAASVEAFTGELCRVVWGQR